MNQPLRPEAGAARTSRSRPIESTALTPRLGDSVRVVLGMGTRSGDGEKSGESEEFETHIACVAGA